MFKDGYGKSVLLSCSVTLEENILHLGWAVESNVGHGLSFTIPPFTNQGKLLSAYIAFRNGDNLLDESYRSAIKVNVKICTNHFF